MLDQTLSITRSSTILNLSLPWHSSEEASSPSAGGLLHPCSRNKEHPSCCMYLQSRYNVLFYLVVNASIMTVSPFLFTLSLSFFPFLSLSLAIYLYIAISSCLSRYICLFFLIIFLLLALSCSHFILPLSISCR
jgi:hypothetical protein